MLSRLVLPLSTGGTPTVIGLLMENEKLPALGGLLQLSQGKGSIAVRDARAGVTGHSQLTEN
jgi:hypothetical protein